MVVQAGLHIVQYRLFPEQTDILEGPGDAGHYIEWILVDYGNEQIIKHFLPHEEPKLVVDFKDGMVAYSYCNKHSLWMNGEIK